MPSKPSKLFNMCLSNPADTNKRLLMVTIGEFCGTFMFLLLSFIGAQTAIVSNDPLDPTAPLGPASLFYIASAFGGAAAVNIWIFSDICGSSFNPAVTLGHVLIGKCSVGLGVCAFAAEVVAGIAASAVADGLLPGPLKFANRLGGGATPEQAVFIEMFLTAQLVLTVYFLTVEQPAPFKQPPAPIVAPVAIGMSIFAAHICATHWTGTSINPARSFGPDVLVGFASYHWVYWIGPLLGAVVAFGVYTSLTLLRGDYSHDADCETTEDGNDPFPPLTYIPPGKGGITSHHEHGSGNVVKVDAASPSSPKTHRRGGSEVSGATQVEGE